MKPRLRIVFAGTPDFAAQALAAITAAGFAVPLVLTQPDRPAGRGMKLSPSAVKRFALARGLPLAQPMSLRLGGKYPDDAATALQRLHATPHDVIVVAAYGLILPQAVLDLPPHGCINIHASLLPRWRGAAPIQRAIEAGDTETGITLMQMDAGLDTGAMISRTVVPIAPTATTAVLHDALAVAGASAIVDALTRLEADGRLASVPQPADGVTYAEKIAKSEAAIDWSQSAVQLARRIRAFDPAPGTVGTIGDGTIKVWAARPLGDEPGTPVAAPGTVLAVDTEHVTVACGRGALALTECQKPGGKRLPIREFLAGFPMRAGQRFVSTLVV